MSDKKTNRKAEDLREYGYNPRRITEERNRPDKPQSTRTAAHQDSDSTDRSTKISGTDSSSKDTDR